MDNLNKKKQAELQDKYEDLVFETIIAYYVQDEYKKIKEKAEQEKTLDTAKVEKLYDKQERKENFGIVLNFSKKAVRFVAMLVLIAVASLTTSIIAFAEVREAVAEVLYHIITEDHGEYTSVDVGEHTGFIDPEIYDWDGAYAPTYMPEGYEYTNKFISDIEKSVTYANESNKILFSQYFNSSYIRADTEGADSVQNIQIGESAGLLVIKGGVTSVYWNIGEVALSVRGTDSTERIIQVAESIKIMR